ncbi:DUF4198 domain-containing protein [Chitinophaga nivalis]|uniref:DUF4198 domain-containing protein n=1 Tax=Chitinophaga nivalis TaxID=2991709 RepID=A0ABT3IGI7_9BACT|nr:DUF4198 domain-containing protein [Chitinophaga nivalis]MCW3467225.1 DUF4198 domain-containing protein [Chitinophaga nivalis]MCW3483083.1 DUF4198 domain-containing protein [Chitinophaga nivalis]
MKKTALAIGILFISALAFGHEFWLQPVKFILGINEPVNVRVMVGENYKGERSDGTKYRIQQLKHFAVGVAEDYTAHVNGSKSANIHAAFATAGNHLLAFSNTGKYISLEAEKFNAYLLEEGLDDIAALRKERGETGKPGREYYQRCAKTLLQVGEGQDDTYALHTGMRMELIPGKNPYALKEGESVTFKVLFDQAPVNNALVLAWNVYKGKTSVTKYRSNAAGEVTFPVQRRGRWMISSVHMIPYTDAAVADWNSFWGSYTFGY